VILVKSKASKVISCKLNGIYENIHIILGTVLHVMVQGVGKFIYFRTFLERAIIGSVCEIAEATISFIMSVCLSTVCL